MVSILGYPSENPHHELHIHKLVTHFDFRTSNFLGFFRHLPHFLVISILDFYLFCCFFFFGIFGHYISDNTKYQYLNNISIQYRQYPILFRTTTLLVPSVSAM